jgi:outer membrane murein-binding lipoprotein Lpp
LAGCVPTSDYEALQKENQELQKSVDTLNVQIRQMHAQLLMAQQQQAQTVELQARLEQAKKEAEALFSSAGGRGQEGTSNKLSFTQSLGSSAAEVGGGAG